MNISELRPGMTIVLNREVYQIENCEHSKRARGSAFLRTKLKELSSGKTIEETLRDSDKIKPAYIEKKKVQFLYADPPLYHFMNLENYEDFPLDESKIKPVIKWLKENLELEGLFYNGTLINLELPSILSLKVNNTEPGVRGNTVKQGTKPAELETKAVIQVPLFIDKGEKIKVNPQTEEYLGRA